MSATETQFDVIVIGGGASGMMAAGVAAARGMRVLLLEKNIKLGEKLKITGGGRCNITNAEYDVRSLLKNYGPAEQFLYSAFSQFGVEETFSFFESRGLPLVVQARKRAFPHTEKAHDVYKVMEKFITEGNVVVKTDAKISRIVTKDDKIEYLIVGTQQYKAHDYILATGGASHPETGSTGDGFKWLKALGHTITEPTPTIVPLAVKERWVHELSGTSLSFMKITFSVNGIKSFSKTGKILFTHFGLSGPLILNSSGDVSVLLSNGTVTASIDMYPDTDEKALDERIIGAFDANKNRDFKNVITEIVPVGTAKAVLELLLIDPAKKVHSIDKDERKLLVSLLKNMPLTITGLMGYDRAVVADGGVTLAEIDMRTMQSKKYNNLFVTGDLLHITRPSGGFSLQLCWTTGYVAGTHVGSSL